MLPGSEVKSVRGRESVLRAARPARKEVVEEVVPCSLRGEPGGAAVQAAARGGPHGGPCGAAGEKREGEGAAERSSYKMTVTPVSPSPCSAQEQVRRGEWS